MNELLQSLFDLIVNDELHSSLLNVKITEDKNGKVTIEYQKPTTPKEITEFKSYIDVMDDSIFEEAAALCKKNNPEAYKELSNDKVTDVEKFNRSVLIFKACVREICRNHITVINQQIAKEQAEIKEYEKYLK